MLNQFSRRFSGVALGLSAAALLIVSCGAVDKLRRKGHSEDSPAPAPTTAPKASKSADANTPSPTATPTPSPAAIENLSIEDYNSFLGLHYGDKIDQVVAIFGQANETSTEGNLNFYRYDIYSSRGINETVLNFSTYKDTGKIFSITVALMADVKETLEYLSRNSVSDKRLQPLGMPLASIQKAFGKETKQSSQMYEYDRKLPNGNDIEVSFRCYDFWSYECRSFEVFWYQKIP